MRPPNCRPATVMIGRAALGKPWVFRDAHHLLLGKSTPATPGGEEIAKELVLHFEQLRETKNDRAAVAEIKKFAAWAAKGFKGENPDQAKALFALASLNAAHASDDHIPGACKKCGQARHT